MESRRINVIPKNPNPLFKMWLREWIEEAEKKKKKISKTYQKALDSLNKYPLTLFSGHDCAILENFGAKICQMLDERLDKHLKERLDLFQLKSHKEKIAELQKREQLKVSELISDIEAACLTDTSFPNTDLHDIDEDAEKRDVSVATNELEEIFQDVEIPDELLSSADSEDSLDQLLKKYDPKAAGNRKKRKKTTESQPVLKKKSWTQANSDVDVIDLSQSSPPRLPETLINDSPVSTLTQGGKKLRKFKTFNSRSQLAGPSHASSPISKFLDVETQSSLLSTAGRVKASDAKRNEDEDEFDKLVARYDFPSPIAVTKPELVRKPSSSKLKGTSVPEQAPLRMLQQQTQIAESQGIPAEDEDDLKFILVDELNPLDFNIILLVDIAETSGKSKASADELICKLKESNVMNDVRKLHVGDFLWIAQHKIDKSKELVLPYIIERKRLDDLSSSIKDGRFHEQKFRLKACGIENVVYLIENHMKAGKVQSGLPFTTLLQAATNTQIHSKFQVKFTENSQHTVLYLTVMTSFIENIFKNKSPIKFQLLEFEKFNQSAVKQRKCTVRETFIKQLLALKGLSVDIALEITKFYPTPRDLYQSYRRMSKADGESLLSKLTIGDLKRKIPAPVSKSIYYFYTRDKI